MPRSKRSANGEIVRKSARTFLIRVPLPRDSENRRRRACLTVHGTLAEAKAQLAIARGRMAQGLPIREEMESSRAPAAAEGTEASYTVGQWLDRWIEDDRAGSVRERTLHEYRETIRLYLKPYLGSTPLRALSKLDMLNWLKALRERGLSPRTVRKSHEVIRNALAKAEGYDLISSNPARASVVSERLPQVKRTERQTISADRLNDFIREARARRLGALFIVMLYGGFRPQEAPALRWRDSKDGVLSPSRTLADRGSLFRVEEEMKTERSRRAVKLPDVATEALSDHAKRQSDERSRAGVVWQENDLIFCDAAGQPLRQDHVRREFRAFLKQAELPRMRLYDLRHSMATLALEAGIDIATISERMGHSTPNLTLSTYTHVTRGMSERVAEVFDRLSQIA